MGERIRKVCLNCFNIFIGITVVFFPSSSSRPTFPNEGAIPLGVVDSFFVTGGMMY